MSWLQATKHLLQNTERNKSVLMFSATWTVSCTDKYQAKVFLALWFHKGWVKLHYKQAYHTAEWWIRSGYSIFGRLSRYMVRKPLPSLYILCQCRNFWLERSCADIFSFHIYQSRQHRRTAYCHGNCTEHHWRECRNCGVFREYILRWLLWSIPAP